MARSEGSDVGKSVVPSGFQPIKNIEREDEEEAKLLRRMAEEAAAYIRSFRWCPNIEDACLGYGVGGVIALFLFEFSEAIGGTGDALWVVVGDVPSAYLVMEGNETPTKALEAYCLLMEEWADAVLANTDRRDVFPVSAAPTTENAQALLSRVRFIRDNILPTIAA
jgi:hypothetical protein